MTTDSRHEVAAGLSGGEAAALERLLVAARDLSDGNFRRRLVPHGDGISAQLAIAFSFRIGQVLREIFPHPQDFVPQAETAWFPALPALVPLGSRDLLPSPPPSLRGRRY